MTKRGIIVAIIGIVVTLLLILFSCQRTEKQATVAKLPGFGYIPPHNCASYADAWNNNLIDSFKTDLTAEPFVAGQPLNQAAFNARYHKFVEDPTYPNGWRPIYFGYRGTCDAEHYTNPPPNQCGNKLIAACLADPVLSAKYDCSWHSANATPDEARSTREWNDYHAFALIAGNCNLPNPTPTPQPTATPVPTSTPGCPCGIDLMGHCADCPHPTPTPRPTPVPTPLPTPTPCPTCPVCPTCPPPRECAPAKRIDSAAMDACEELIDALKGKPVPSLLTWGDERHKKALLCATVLDQAARAWLLADGVSSGGTGQCLELGLNREDVDLLRQWRKNP